MAVEVFMPKMSDHMEAGEVVGWLVEEGDRVEKGQAIVEVLTDKAVAELEALASGVLKGIRIGTEAGVIVPVGETMAFIAEPNEEVPALPPLVSAKIKQAQERMRSSPPTSHPASAKAAEPDGVRATPVARRVARELMIDLALVEGTGPGGRIREKDVRAFAKFGE